MAHPASPKSISDLRTFLFERVLNEDPLTHSIILLGSFPENGDNSTNRVQAIIRIEKTALDLEDAKHFFEPSGLLDRVNFEEGTDIYSWLFGWLKSERERDVKINIIYPATEVHVRKYTKQNLVMIRETSEIYEAIVKPYIFAFPPSRTQWVENIITGVSEQKKVLYSSPEFMILPDMKWDLKTITSLYLMALVQDRTIRSMRDLRKGHIGLLKSIKREAVRVAREKWGIEDGGLRLYIHYQPSYYHFHVHIVNANYTGGALGMMVGQAHLLDDIISLLEVATEEDGKPGILQQMTLTYGLGDQHGLYDKLVKAGTSI